MSTRVKDQDEWLKVKETAQRAKLAPKTVRNRVYRNAIPHYGSGKSLRFKESEIERWIEAGMPSDLSKMGDNASGTTTE